MLSIWKKVALIPALLCSLWLLTDDDDGDGNDSNDNSSGSSSSLAVWTAMSRHPPSLRVYRALLELNLLLFCGALSLWVWERAAGRRVVGILLFAPPQGLVPIRGLYQAVPTTPTTFNDSNDNDDDDALTRKVPHDDHILTEEEAQDACYASDGEIEEEQTTMCPVAPIEPPTAGDVVNASVDLLLLILVSLFLFTISSAEGGKYIDGIEEGYFQWIARIAAPIFPLALFLLAAFKSFFPLQRRRDFWTVVSYTFSAPMCHVTFRDGFIGDVFTSTVRPMQDLAFTVFYVFSGLRGWWTQSYNLDNADLPLESSWLLHTVVLPACMVSPLWWRYLQNLRQSYDNRQRWPYLGNAFKYFIAAQVSMMGLFDPSKKSNSLWIVCFVAATLYQIWWDVFMDWELLQFRSNGWPKLRSARLYPSSSMYWVVLVVNFVLRFGWTLSFLPTWYLDPSGALMRSFGGHYSKVIGPFIASAEIVRRTLWGLFRLELEGIKTCADDPKLVEQLKRCSSRDESTVDGIEMKDMTSQRSLESAVFKSVDERIELNSDMSAKSDLQILAELCLWATAFAGLGMVSAAHRETM